MDNSVSPTGDEARREWTKRSSRILLQAYTMLFFASVPMYFLYELAPMLNPSEAISEAEKSSALLAIENLTRDESSKTDVFVEHSVTIPFNQLLSVQFEVRGVSKRASDGKIISDSRHVGHFAVRYDRIIVFVGLYLVLILTYVLLLRPQMTYGFLITEGVQKVRPKPSIFDVTIDEEVKVTPAEEEVSVTPAVKQLIADARSASEQAGAIFRRATLLLAAGIIMAFVGLLVFYVTLSEITLVSNDPPTWGSYAQQISPASNAAATSNTAMLTFYFWHAARPIGVLIFVEAIAWFLLRQYRALTEDYKWFHRIYMKRCNYLAALRILEKDKVRKEDMFLAAALVNEDLSGRLRKGETTEALEVFKAPEDGPVAQLLGVVDTLYRPLRKKIQKPPQLTKDQKE